MNLLQYYATVNNSPLYLAEVWDLHNDIIRYIGKPLPKVKLQNSKRDVINSASLELGNKTVLYFGHKLK